MKRVLWLLVAGGCRTSTPEPAVVAAPVVEPSPAEPAAPGVTRWPQPERLVAFGDVHGDYEAAQRALRLGGLIDGSGHWSGGETVAVQVGDQLDRGDGEREILDLFERLRVEARKAGGRFEPLLGNHETMNVMGDLRYVTPGGLADFAEFAASAPAGVPEQAAGRVAAMMPGGPYALQLADHPVVLVVGDSLFVHGGVLPAHVDYGLDRINHETRAWIGGKGPAPEALKGPESPLWSRHYSDAPDVSDCALAAEVVATLGISRLVVAHTVQRGGIRPACDGLVWRVDTGMSRHYGGPVQVIEIVDDEVRVLREPG